MKKWYGVRTFPGYEQKVKEKMASKITKDGIESYIDEIYTPSYKKFVFVSKKLRLKEELLFPGYVFIKMNLTNEVMYSVRGVQYVTGYAGVNNGKKNPDPIEDEEVNRMKDQTKNITIDLHEKEKVFINDGYEKIEAVVKKIDCYKQNMEVLIEDEVKSYDFSFVEKYKAQKK